jgi:hypothetical protein
VFSFQLQIQRNSANTLLISFIKELGGLWSNIIVILNSKIKS